MLLSTVIGLSLVLLGCIKLGDAATAVDVYRLIQYDLAGSPFGSRLSNLNHHAVSSLNAPNVDLSRAVVIIPIHDLHLYLSSIQGFYFIFYFILILFILLLLSLTLKSTSSLQITLTENSPSVVFCFYYQNLE